MLTEEMLEAMGVARSVYDERDTNAARMAFREAYTRLVQEARDRRDPVKWFRSYGTDAAGRDVPVASAAQKHLAAPRQDRRAIEAADDLVPMPPEIRERIKAITGKE